MRTGIYWRPVFNLLEEGHTIILVNARHMKAVPGRKTDIKDAEWIVELLRHGLLKASFIPSKPTRDLRELVRSRKTLVQERAQEINRLHKVLETANIKLSSVVSDVLGKSGRRMLAAMIEGVSDAEALADLARGTLRHKLPQLQQALRGQVQPHHQVLLGQIFAHISYLEHSIQQLQGEIEQRLYPFEEAMQLRLAYSWHAGDCRGGYSGGNWRGYESLSLGQASGAPSPGCVQATNKAEASVSQARPPRATSACAPC